MSLSFGRKINYLPLLNSVLGGIIIGLFFFLLSQRVGIAILFGAVCLLVILMLYTLKIRDNLDQWQVDDRGIHYQDYSTTSKRIKAILLHGSSNEETVKFSDIKEFSIVTGKGMDLPKGIGPDGPIDVAFYVVDSTYQAFSSPYYLSLKLAKGEDVDLDLSANAQDVAAVNKVIKKIEEKTNLQVKLEKQRV
ncbi:MAG TPA: hypothetical protein H9820_13650 [Candidatus Companilactobacillus pullicola]|uniref:Uncharacterized protein n=1 Tax=Candidatus Companilactobacillus pullicola TaxID=2838523 RepID=A0A9D1ZR60_9LACO|nr:hypothetical protein [Candidatus Companilactobacillus pullicola]